MTRLATVLLCEDTGLRPNEDWVCPFHGGDACIFMYYHLRTVYPHGHPTDWAVIPKSEYEGLKEALAHYRHWFGDSCTCDGPCPLREL